MRKVKIEQGSVIDSELDHSISSEQPLSLHKSKPMPEEVVFLDPGLANRVKLLGRERKQNLCESQGRQKIPNFLLRNTALVVRVVLCGVR